MLPESPVVRADLRPLLDADPLVAMGVLMQPTPPLALPATDSVPPAVPLALARGLWKCRESFNPRYCPQHSGVAQLVPQHEATRTRERSSGVVAILLVLWLACAIGSDRIGHLKRTLDDN